MRLNFGEIVGEIIAFIPVINIIPNIIQAWVYYRRTKGDAQNVEAAKEEAKKTIDVSQRTLIAPKEAVLQADTALYKASLVGMIPIVNIVSAIYSASVLKELSDARKSDDEYITEGYRLTEKEKKNTALIDAIKIIDNWDVNQHLKVVRLVPLCRQLAKEYPNETTKSTDLVALALDRMDYYPIQHEYDKTIKEECKKIQESVHLSADETIAARIKKLKKDLSNGTWATASSAILRYSRILRDPNRKLDQKTEIKKFPDFLNTYLDKYKYDYPTIRLLEANAAAEKYMQGDEFQQIQTLVSEQEVLENQDKNRFLELKEKILVVLEEKVLDGDKLVELLAQCPKTRGFKEEQHLCNEIVKNLSNRLFEASGSEEVIDKIKPDMEKVVNQMKTSLPSYKADKLLKICMGLSILYSRFRRAPAEIEWIKKELKTDENRKIFYQNTVSTHEYLRQNYWRPLEEQEKVVKKFPKNLQRLRDDLKNLD